MYQELSVEARGSKKELHPRKLRRSGWVPGVVYGKDSGSHSVKFKREAIRKLVAANEHIIEMAIPGKSKELVNIQSIQHDPINQEIIHVGFHIVKRGVETELTVPISFEGDSPGVKEGGVIAQVLNEVSVKCLPKDAPKEVILDISKLAFDSHLTLKDVSWPSGVKVDSGVLDQTVATCHAPKPDKEPEPQAETEEAKAEEGGSSEESAKPEGS